MPGTIFAGHGSVASSDSLDQRSEQPDLLVLTEIGSVAGGGRNNVVSLNPTTSYTHLSLGCQDRCHILPPFEAGGFFYFRAILQLFDDFDQHLSPAIVVSVLATTEDNV
jgi:hypothetical protein